ncbi:MAG: hypothetical protein WB421_09635 [Terriglobales bacterium]
MRNFALLATVMLVASFCYGQEQGTSRKTPADFGRDLKLSDLPSSADKPLSPGRAAACADLASLMDPKLGNGDLSQVSDEVLSQLYRADSLCWADTMDLASPTAGLNATHVDLQVETVKEMTRRRYNQLVAKYNDLLANYNNLMQISRMQSELLDSATPNVRAPQTIQVIAPPPQQQPVNLFPSSPLQQRSQQVNCTTYSTGIALNTTCTGQ